MADNDYNTVQPIDSLQNVLGITPTEQQPQQRRKAPQKDRQQHSPAASDDQAKKEAPQDSHDSNHLIDYRA
jgi:hypothetical protein